MIIRWILLLVVLAVIIAVALFFRQVGLGEWGLLVALFAWVFVVESTLFVGRRFWRGYRRGAAKRTKRQS